MGKTWGALAVSALVLAGCGQDTTPTGLAQHLEAEGVPLDGVSAERYYEAVQSICSDEGKHSAATLRGFAANEDALQRMVVGMDYVCPGRGDDLAIMVEAIGD